MLDEILLQLSVSGGTGRLQGHGWVVSGALPVEGARPYELPCPVPCRPRCPWM